MWYNFGRVHQRLCVTPAMQPGVTDHVWSVEEIGSSTPAALDNQRRARSYWRRRDKDFTSTIRHTPYEDTQQACAQGFIASPPA
jgi:hypothetical protein